MSVRVEIKCLREDAQPPRYMSEFAAGADLVAAIDEDLVIPPGGRIAVGTGLALAISTGYEGQVRPRSGMALRHGLTVVNAPGTIDSDYRGEVKVLLVNLGQEPVCIEPGQRIAQLVIAPVVQADFCVVDELSETVRGAGGFGSTGSSS
ncbi:MAG: dUTP diphosphatase [Kofleriaceae bacterium]|nr:dUTP diphosphatase [Kofleriaceae bacterium]